MRFLALRIYDFTKPELDKLRQECNFTDEEKECFEFKAKNKTNQDIAFLMNVSPSKVSYLTRKIKNKISKVM